MKIRVREPGPWKPVFLIASESIAFQERSFDPYEIFFLKMDE